ncbi:MAG: hypothetical protein AAGF10_06205 [Verrucomicrobiota bacterium]
MIMRTLALLTLLFTAPLALLADVAEAEFEQRLRTAHAAGKVDAYRTIYDFTSTPVDVQKELLEKWQALEGLEITQITFRPIPEQMKNLLLRPIKIAGKSYVINLEPLKLVETKYFIDAENEPVAHLFAVGMKDGKYYAPGLKPE